LQRLVEEAEALGGWGQQHRGAATQEPPLRSALAALARVMPQDLAPDPAGGGRRRRRGTGRDRLPSLGDREMRHGRKSKAYPFTGDTRHVRNLLGSHLVVDAVAQPAHQPAHAALETLWPSLAVHGQVPSLSIDRASLSSPLIGALQAQGIAMIAQPWPLRHRGRFTKEALQLRLDRHEVTCPAGVTVRLRGAGRRVPFPADTCGRCALQADCPAAARGRTRSMHPQEALLLEWRAMRRTAEGREALRQRTEVEHTLARIDPLQGKRARYKGTRKNTLDLRRTAAVHTLQHLHRVQAVERVAGFR
jgi:Transposase DDE domain